MSGTSLRRFGLSKSSVDVHRREHLKPATSRAIARREDLGPEALLKKLDGYLADAEHGIEIAKDEKDLAGLARCIKEARETVVYLGKAQGLWADKPSTVIDARRQTLNIASLSIDELPQPRSARRRGQRRFFVQQFTELFGVSRVDKRLEDRGFGGSRHAAQQ